MTKKIKNNKFLEGWKEKSYITSGNVETQMLLRKSQRDHTGAGEVAVKGTDCSSRAPAFGSTSVQVVWLYVPVNNKFTLEKRVEGVFQW